MAGEQLTLFAVELTAEQQVKVRDYVESFYEPESTLIEDPVLKQLFDQIPDPE